MEAGPKLIRWRREHGLSQRDAAALAKVSQAAWHAVEAGSMKRIGLDVARAIVAVTKGAVTLDDLSREPPRRPSTPPPRRRTGTDG